jgi:hypothetical protein
VDDTVKQENAQLKEELLALKDRQKSFEDMFLALSTDLPKEKLAKLVNRELCTNTVK